ncbi:MAG: electron transport complex subunit RsxD [Gammaproteobacteria bacterium RIFCSPLOWO2_02_47_7]|nr:MAG: electron transport complex subunit RsxD [Gammaproteobacteria bacterium RIFCSPLOWO2_02_47_7]
MMTRNETVIISSPHLHAGTSINHVMTRVIYALIPGILLSVWFFGSGVLIQSLLAVLFALCAEALMLYLREKPLRLFLFDGSAVVTALLFALCLSPYTPVWVNFTGICFAIIVAKHLYGGIGYNMFNPAMAGYVFVLLCFPVNMTTWPLPAGITDQQATLLQILSIIFTGPSSLENFDSLSGATTLGWTKSQLSGMFMITEIRNSPLFGSFAGKGTEWIAVAWLCGGIWLLIQRIIKWEMPVFFIGTVFLISLLFYWYDSSIYLSPVLTLFTGGIMLATFFIITDPVTASATPRGRIIYVIGIGLLTYIIRTWSAYPDGVAFAVLLMNAVVPLVDNYTRPRVFGEIKHG